MSKEMRKFWNLMLVALVTMGAAACTETDENVDKTPEQSAGLSFYAEISNDTTRADLEYDAESKVWNTVWEGNETLVITDYSDYTEYLFSNSEAEKNKFTCTDEGAKSLIGKMVSISNYDASYSTSRSGKKTLHVYNFIDEFSVEKPIKLTSEISFLRYTYNGEGSVTFNVSFNNGNADINVFREADADGEFSESVPEITFEGIKGENWVPVWPCVQSGTDQSATLSYSINGVKCKETTIKGFGYGKVYNLGTLADAEQKMTKIYFVPNDGWKADGAWFAAHVWNETSNLDVKFSDEDGDGIYECSIPADMTSMLFCRMNPEFTEFGWNVQDAEGNIVEHHVWNQTIDTTVGVDPDNYFYITDWDKGIWGTKDGYDEPIVEFSIGLIGLGGNWETDTDMTLEDDYYTLKGVAIADTDSFKLRVNDAWEESYGVGSAEEVDAITIEANKRLTLANGGKNMQLAAGTYDLYFNYSDKAFYALTDGKTPADIVETPIVWSLAGEFNNWSDLIMTETAQANLFVAKGVDLLTGSKIKVKDSTTWETSFGGGITFLNANSWMTAYHNGADIEIAKSGTYDVYFEYLGNESKIYLMEVDVDYTTATQQTENGTAIPDETEEETPDQPTAWSVSGTFNGWGDTAMVTTTVKNLFVAKSVTLDAYASFKVRKDMAWTENYGGGIVYMNPNGWIELFANGSDVSNTAAGTFDIYFDYANKRLYLVTAGGDYSAVAQQTVEGEEPKQEEPEVTANILYLKPNANWKQANARFAAYFFGNGDKWVSMTDEDGDGIYEVNIPEGYDYGCNVIFCRMNPGTTANNWNNKWNQTADLKAPTDGKNLYTVKEGTWDKGGGTWSVK